MADKFHLSDETITISQLEIIISESEIIRIARKWNIKKRTTAIFEEQLSIRHFRAAMIREGERESGA